MKPSSLEVLLGRLLYYGTWAASLTIATGLVLLMMKDVPPATALRWATDGIALLILLPVTRVAIMLLFFLRDRDYRLALAAALVLAAIAAGILVGIRSSAGAPEGPKFQRVAALSRS